MTLSSKSPMDEYDPLLAGGVREEYNPQLAGGVREESFEVPVSQWDYLMFMSIGLGSSWVLLTTVYVELPWFERSQPEGVQLAAWFGMVGAFALATSLFVNRLGGPYIKGGKAALFLGVFHISGMLFAALTWNETIAGYSVFIMFASFAGELVGNLSICILIPWVAANFPQRLTSAYISGEGLMGFFCVMLQLIQSPGQYRRFSPTIYFSILALPCISSICCIMHIQKFTRVRKSPTTLPTKRRSLCPLWYRQEGLKYSFYKIWIDAITFLIVTVILPYACATTDPEEHLGTAVLQWCSGLGTTGLLAGNILSSFLDKDSNFHLKPVIVLMTCLEIIIVLAMYDIPGGGFWARWKLLIVADITVMRFGWGWVTPLIFRDIARKMPEIAQEAGSLMAFWVQVVSMAIKLVMFILAVTSFKTEPVHLV